ncbi:MAG: SAM-dependent methyltransferase, partial [Chloroflexi bacterium]|nr:SAM-dependent methyltransferase [Chloroflexota bacterium]
MNTENLLIITAHPEFLQAAVAELKQLDKRLTSIEELTPDIMLCGTPDPVELMHRAEKERPTFVRHLAPVQATADLGNEERDIGIIATAIASLPAFALLERGTHFAVQSRFAQTDKSYGGRPYSSGKLNQALAEAFAEETEAIEDIKKPRVVISILCTMHKAYLGISTTEENLSSWPGGARHFAQTSEQISRAEFKLLEALEVFDITLPKDARALDLGAAPGGWTRLLLDAGMSVVAVDPANLDPRIVRRKRLEHYRGYAENYLEAALRRHSRFAVIVNDMRMDAREAARLLAKASDCLQTDGFVVSVFKLPHATREINPLTTLKEAMRILKERYG